MNEMVFRDREHAGGLLGEALRTYAHREDVRVLGLPRGGVVVAAAVARWLHAPLDVLVVRKLGVPGWEELAMGAIASGGVRVLNSDVIRAYRVTTDQVEQRTLEQANELQRRELTYRGHMQAMDVAGTTVVVVDDGIATGSTMRAAVMSLRERQPAAVVIAVPTASREAAELLEPLADELVVLSRPEVFRSVGEWYQDFSQTTDHEVHRLLKEMDAFHPSHP